MIGETDQSIDLTHQLFAIHGQAGLSPARLDVRQDLLISAVSILSRDPENSYSANSCPDYNFLTLGSNPSAVVLNVGCGLDTRVSRINPPSDVNWFDLDYPEVIDERRNFYSDQGQYLVEVDGCLDSLSTCVYPFDVAVGSVSRRRRYVWRRARRVAGSYAEGTLSYWA